MEREELLEDLYVTTQEVGRCIKQLFIPVIRNAGLTLSQIHILWIVSEAGAIPGKDLAKKLSMTPSSVTQTTDSIVKAGWIKRRPDERDRRTVYLELTPAGKTKIEEFKQLHKNFLIRMNTPLSDTELVNDLAKQKKTLAHLKKLVAEQAAETK